MSSENNLNKTKIDNEYYIDSDSYQLLLQRKSVAQSGKNKGEDIYTTVGHHGTLESVLNNYKKIKVRENIKNCEDLKEIKLMLKQLDNKIENFFDSNNM